MTHGTKGGVISAKDQKMNVEDLWKPFNGISCPNLTGKPKLFIIQGHECSTGVVPKESEAMLSNDDDGYNYFVIPSHADFLIFYSHEIEKFIEILCDNFREYLNNNDKIDLLTILTAIKQESAESEPESQVPTVFNALTKMFVFKK